MKPYDREKPLISIHVPKCAGGSFGVVLQSWFGPNLCPHYPNWELRQTPPRYDLKEGICIHGHFNSFKGVGVLDYYPQVEQFITILRDPFEMAVSFYFFRKRPDKDGPTWEKRRPPHRNEEILPELRDEFVENHPLEYAVYEYALKHYKQ
ncbi:MAG: sulfotransferase family 2 domain-containing protein [Deltaproteobacteria bacterium]|nr:sulfotransferase family 2 domain-containing protein [Deltaproteobacteria bacterium]